MIKKLLKDERYKYDVYGWLVTVAFSIWITDIVFFISATLLYLTILYIKTRIRKGATKNGDTESSKENSVRI